MALTIVHPATGNRELQRLKAAVIGAIVSEARTRLFGLRAGPVDKGALAGRSFSIDDFGSVECVLLLLIDDLAESYGVAAGFMSVRLARGSFMGRPQPAGSRN